MTNEETIRLPEPLDIDQGHQKLAVQILFTFARSEGLDDEATKGLINIYDERFSLWKVFTGLETSDFLPADDIHMIRTGYLLKIITHLRQQFDTQDTASKWLAMPNHSLGCIKPIDLLTSGTLKDMHTVCEHLTRRADITKICTISRG